MKVIGKAKSLNVIRKCCYCNESFFMTCEDYVFNRCGQIMRNKEEMREGWICEDCKNKILEIKNL